MNITAKNWQRLMNVLLRLQQRILQTNKQQTKSKDFINKLKKNVQILKIFIFVQYSNNSLL